MEFGSEWLKEDVLVVSVVKNQEPSAAGLALEPLLDHGKHIRSRLALGDQTEFASDNIEIVFDSGLATCVNPYDGSPVICSFLSILLLAQAMGICVRDLGFSNY